MNFDQIRKRELVESPETVNADWTSSSVSLDDRISGWSLRLKYTNGIDVDMKIYLQFSNDNVTFGTLAESLEIITDDSGSILYDMSGSGAEYARIYIQVTGGSIDVTSIYYVAVQAH